MGTGVSNASTSDLVTIDSEFLKRLQLRRDILREHPTSSMRATPRAEPAIRELYEYLAGFYLPKRYPTLFRTRVDGGEAVLENLASAETYPQRAPSATDATMQRLGTLVDEDFIFLMPPPDGTRGEYTIQGWVVCFTSGFDLPPLLEKPLSFVHAPVPGYEEKLGLSMTRWFDRLAVGRLTRRYNVRFGRAMALLDVLFYVICLPRRQHSGPSPCMVA